VYRNDTTIKASFNKKIEVSFDGGQITTDAGLLLYREFENKLPFMDIIGKHVDFRRRAAVHDDASVIRQMVYLFIAGYEDDVDANGMRHDPLLPLLLDRGQLASQPTVSRCMNYYSMPDVWAFQRGNLDVISSVQRNTPEVTLDFDTTDIPTYGKQEGGRHNGYYGGVVRQAMLCFNHLGDCAKATLYNGADAASAKAPGFCKSPVNHYLRRGASVRLRADRLFGSEPLYSWCEKRGVLYYIRLKSSHTQEDVRQKCGASLVESATDPGVFHGEYLNECRSRWSRKRRICVRIKPRPGELFPEVTCVITNDETIPPQQAVEFYLLRCVCENHIKEGKLGFSFSRLSHTSFTACALRLQIQVLAYNVNNLLRRLCMPLPFASHYIQTLRAKLIKLGARIVHTGRRFIIRCSSACPFKELFARTHENILSLKLSPG
jgi:hypothetical protein